MEQKQYANYIKKTSGKSPILKDCIYAFLFGGIICTMGQVFLNVLKSIGVSDKAGRIWESIILIFLACLLTAFGIFDKIAKKGGAGCFVPITGFANAICSPAIDNKAEGWVLGLGAKMFTIAGPVIVYGTVASVIYGIIYWITTLF